MGHKLQERGRIYSLSLIAFTKLLTQLILLLITWESQINDSI